MHCDVQCSYIKYIPELCTVSCLNRNEKTEKYFMEKDCILCAIGLCNWNMEITKYFPLVNQNQRFIFSGLCSMHQTVFHANG